MPKIAVATDKLSILVRYFRQFQKKRALNKAKAPIEEGVNSDKILKRILEGEMQLISKEL